VKRLFILLVLAVVGAWAAETIHGNVVELKVTGAGATLAVVQTGSGKVEVQLPAEAKLALKDHVQMSVEKGAEGKFVAKEVKPMGAAAGHEGHGTGAGPKDHQCCGMCKKH
jgi:hypothetical protein